MKKTLTCLCLFFSLLTFAQHHHIPPISVYSEQQANTQALPNSRVAIDTIDWAPQDNQLTLIQISDPAFPIDSNHPCGYAVGTDQLLASTLLDGPGYPGSVTFEDGQIFTTPTKINVIGAKFAFGYKAVFPGDMGFVVFKLYKLDGTFVNAEVKTVPGPGTLISTDTVNVLDIKKLQVGADNRFSGSETIYFNTPLVVDAGDGYFLSFDITGLNQYSPLDTLALYSSPRGTPPVKELSLTQSLITEDPNTLIPAWKSFLDPQSGFAFNIDLAIFPIADITIFDTISAALCEDSTLHFLDSVFTTAGSHNYRTSPPNNYDTLFTFELYQSLPDTGVLYDTIPAGGKYNLFGTNYADSGLLIGHLRNHLGCDSTLLVHLALSDSINTSITVAGGTLTSGQSHAQYLWLNCSTGKADTSVTDTLQVFIPGESGSYKVIVTQYHNSDTSACISVTLGIDQLRDISFSLYPNPALGNCTIYPGDITGGNWSAGIFNLQGQLVRNLFTNEQNMQARPFSTQGLAAGLYLVKVAAGNGATGIKKLVIE